MVLTERPRRDLSNGTYLKSVGAIVVELLRVKHGATPEVIPIFVHVEARHSNGLIPRVGALRYG